jgi:predicted O-methyltransferase YrrM
MEAAAVLREIEKQAQSRFLPIIGPQKGKYLEETVRESRPMEALEVGTLVGYSAVLIARNMPQGGRLITIEINPQAARIARENIARAGFGDSVTVLQGDARDVIPTLKDTFDMAFIDAAKEQYFTYLRLCEPRLKKGAVVFADNVKMFARAMRDYLDYVRHSGKYRSRFVDVGFDGVEISVKLF